MFTLFLSALTVFIPDQHIKHKIRQDRNLPRPLGRHVILRYSRNRGMFMNLLQNHPRFVSVLTSCVLAVLSVFAFFTCRKESSILLGLAFGLMCGGAASNVYDHLTCGFVTDYISFCRPARFSHIVYNLADFAIFLSVIMMTAASAKL
ncbi:MAG: signal peptidase II [Lachnospiraceae bacterium]